MNILMMILPPISVLSAGLFITNRLKKPLKIQLNVTEYYLSALLFGISSLVIPATLIGLLFPGYLNRYMYIFEGLTFTYAIFTLFRNIPKTAERFMFLRRTISEIHPLQTPQLANLSKFFTLLIIIEYGIMLTIYPLRGWDALHFYFPHGFVFYLYDRIPAVDPLNFIPIFKPPLVSMYIAYTYYLTSEPATNYFPFLFLTGITISIYEISNKIKNKTDISLIPSLSTLIFLSFPFTYFLIFEWAYYQELPITMIYILVLYGVLKIEMEKQNKKELFYWLVFISAGLSLAPLTKINGYALFFVYFMLIKGNNFIKAIKTTGVGIVTIFLAKKAANSIHVLIGIFVLFLGILLIIIIWRKEGEYNIKRSIVMYLPIFIGLIPGMGWLYHIVNTVPGTKQFLINTYVKSKTSHLVWEWEGINNPAVTTYIENAHKADIISAVGIIFIGSLFVLPWIWYKIKGIELIVKDNKTIGLITYSTTYFLIWIAYFSNGSSRYLSILLPTIAIFVSVGFTSFLEKIKNKATSYSLISSMIFTILLGFGAVYPFYPFQYIPENVHMRYYLFHKNIITGLSYAIFFLLLTIGIALFNHVNIKKKWVLHTERALSIFLIILLIFTPLSGQIILLADTGFDIQKFQTKWVYDYRENILDLSKMISTVAEPDEITIGVNIPGVELFSKRSVIDLMTIYQYNKDLPFNDHNLTRLLNLLTNNSILYLVNIRQQHDFYLEYLRSYFPMSMFTYSVSGAFGTLLYENPEFSLYKLTTQPLIAGPVIIGYKYQSRAWTLYQEIYPLDINEDQPEGIFLECYWPENVLEAEVSYSIRIYSQDSMSWTNQTKIFRSQLPQYLQIYNNDDTFQITYVEIKTRIILNNGEIWLRTWKTSSSFSVVKIENHSPIGSENGIPTLIKVEFIET